MALTREEIAAQLETAYSASNWSELLRMLRYQNDLMPRAVVDYMRYRAWSELGYQEVVLAFIQNAVRLDPVSGEDCKSKEPKLAIRSTRRLW